MATTVQTCLRAVRGVALRSTAVRGCFAVAVGLSVGTPFIPLDHTNGMNLSTGMLKTAGSGQVIGEQDAESSTDVGPVTADFLRGTPVGVTITQYLAREDFDC